MVATTANFPVRLLWPLVTGEQIFVQQLGCGASAKPAAAAKVLAPPALPLPTVVGSYVLTTAASVLVNNVVPGAQVTLFVNHHARNAPVDSIGAETGPPTRLIPLTQVPLYVVCEAGRALRPRRFGARSGGARTHAGGVPERIS